MSESEVLVMFVTLVGEGTARNISDWHKIMTGWSVGKGQKRKK